jgi:NAD-dependent SIR2 family protein deacetylase
MSETCIVDGSHVKYSDLLHDYLALEGSKLSALNARMATLRAKSRWASLSKFHQFLHRAFDNGLVARWLTRNFDGLETCDRPDLVDHVLMVHGDNQVLRCASPDCPGISGDAVVELDRRLLRGELVMCQACFTPGEIS